MWFRAPRALLLCALLLDWVGQLLILAVIMLCPVWIESPIGSFELDGQKTWLIFCLLVYPLFSWLFGSYTVLRWRRLAFPVLIQRLTIATAVTLIVVVIARWLMNPGEEVWLVHRWVQFVWLGALTAWSLLIRVALRRGLFLPDTPRLMLLASDDEIAGILQAWTRVAPLQRLQPIPLLALEQLLNEDAPPLLVALSPSRTRDPSFSGLIERLEIQDPRQIQTISVITLFEQQQERLPPSLLADYGVTYDELPWLLPSVSRLSSSGLPICL